MALDARTRSSLYGKFADLVGDEDANALMSQFPSIEAEELVTKQFLRAELAELRSELRSEIAGSHAELRSVIVGSNAELRSEITGSHAELRSETAGLGVDLRGEIAELRTEMIDRFHQQTVWFGGALGAATALLAAIGLFT